MAQQKSDELDMTIKTARFLSAAFADMADSINYRRTTNYFRSVEQERLELLGRITKNGTRVPYIQEFGAENTKFSHIMSRKIDEFNRNADPADRVDYFIGRTTDGRHVLWTDEKGAEKINELRKELVIGFGEYYSEVKPSELYQANQQKKVVTLDGVSREELDVLKSKPVPGGTDFSFAAYPNGDGTYRVEVGEKDFITDKHREDLFVNLVRANAIAGNPARGKLLDELKYDRELKERMISYDKDEPTYITSATDGGRYIKIEKNGFKVYSVGMNANDVRQMSEQEVSRSMYKDKPEEYEKLLYKAVNSVNRPLEINAEVCRRHEKELEKLYGREAKFFTTDHRIAGITAQDFEKTRMRFSKTEDKNVSRLTKQIEMKANRAFAAHMAARIYCEAEKNGTLNDKTAMKDRLSGEDMRREIRTMYFKEHFIHMEPQLHREFMEQVQNTELYKQFSEAAIDPALKDELMKTVNNSYQDFYEELSPEFQKKIEENYLKYEQEIKENAGKALDKGLSKYAQQETDRLRNEPEDRAFQVILAKCVTGKTIEDIRPMQMNIADIRESEFYDELNRAFAEEVEIKLVEKAGKEAVYDPEILKSEVFAESVDTVAAELEQLAREDRLKEKSPKWRSLSRQAYDFDGIDGDKIKELKENVKSLSEYETKTLDVKEEVILKAEELEKSEPEAWKMLECEHDEENISRLLKESIRMEDVDLSGNVEKMQDAFHERVEEYELDEDNGLFSPQGRNEDGEINVDFDMQPDMQDLLEEEENEDRLSREEEDREEEIETGMDID